MAERGGGFDREISLKAIGWTAFGLAAMIAVSMALMGLLFGSMKKGLEADNPPPPPFARPADRDLPPMPRLQAKPEVELEEMRAAEEEALSSAGWLNQETGVARIPIEAAIDFVAERGLPVWPAPDTQTEAAGGDG